MTADGMSSPADLLPRDLAESLGVMADAHDRFALTSAIRRCHELAAQLAAVATSHAENLCRIANVLDAAADHPEPIDRDLFRRTAPKWNCVDYPGDGPHYTPGTDGCLWCGKTREEIAARFEELGATAEQAGRWASSVNGPNTHRGVTTDVSGPRRRVVW